MGEKYAVFIKNLGLSFIASFLPNVLAFFMIPLYTRCLTDAEYGAADLLMNTSQLLAPILTIQIKDAVMRFAMDDAWAHGDVLRVGIRIAVRGFCVLCLGCAVFFLLYFLKVPFPGSSRFDCIYVLFLMFTYLSSSLLNIVSYFCRGMNQVSVLTEGSLLNMSLFVSFNLLFLWKWKWGLHGYLAANLIGVSVNALYIFFRAGLFRYIFRRTSVGNVLVKEMVHFSVPLIFSALSWWINNASDKYILTLFHGMSVVGLYAVAYKIPTILKVFGDVVSMAFSISAIREFNPEDTDGFIGNSYSLISLFMVLCCSGLILCNRLVAKMLFARDFFMAWRFVPPLLFSVLMNQLSVACENILVAAKQTKAISVTAIAGAVLNTAANFLLIPYFGAYGAAVATAVGFTCFWALRYYKLKKTVRMKNDFRRECISYILMILQCVAAYWGSRFWILQIAIFMMMLILYRKKIIWILLKKKGLYHEIRRISDTSSSKTG